MAASNLEPRCVADVQAVLGEGPVWVERDAALYWVDIKGPAIFRLDEDASVTRWTPPFAVCSLAPRVDGGFIAGTEHGFATIDHAAGRFDLIHDPEPDFATNRFNDGKVDRHGRFWAGTMDDTQRHVRGSLYRLAPDLTTVRVDEGYGVTNGPAFSPAGKIMYHTDSVARTVFALDVAANGTVSNKRVFVQFCEADGSPDGMTVDREGCLWIAFWNGWCIRRLSPAGETLQQVAMPVRRPTSCAFGGPGLDRLYITSARIGVEDEGREPLAGGLFVIEPEVGGIAERPFG